MESPEAGVLTHRSLENIPRPIFRPVIDDNNLELTGRVVLGEKTVQESRKVVRFVPGGNNDLEGGYVVLGRGSSCSGPLQSCKPGHQDEERNTIEEDEGA